MYQQLWGYKVEEKLYLGVREQKRLNTTGLGNALYIEPNVCSLSNITSHRKRSLLFVKHLATHMLAGRYRTTQCSPAARQLRDTGSVL
jgi:hypothetical protein